MEPGPSSRGSPQLLSCGISVENLATIVGRPSIARRRTKGVSRVNSTSAWSPAISFSAARTSAESVTVRTSTWASAWSAIKAEAITELAASQEGLHVVKVAPQSLKRKLGCAAEQKWRDRAAELFNPDGKRQNWSKGAAGAVAAAFTVAVD